MQSWTPGYPARQAPAPTSDRGPVRAALSSGTWTHDHPIRFDEATRLGLKVSSEMPHEVMQLMSLFAQPMRHQPSVQYVPVDRPPPRPSSGGQPGAFSVTAKAGARWRRPLCIRSE
ncbi:MAG TPA: hypothetical protein VGK52_19405 [Polyangia bacterium]